MSSNQVVVATDHGEIDLTDISSIEDFSAWLRGFTTAYDVAIFREPTPSEREWLHRERPGLQDRIAADMGRHLATHIAAAADVIDAMGEQTRRGDAVARAARALVKELVANVGAGLISQATLVAMGRLETVLGRYEEAVS